MITHKSFYVLFSCVLITCDMASLNQSSLSGYFKPQLPCPNRKLTEIIVTHTIRKLKIHVRSTSTPCKQGTYMKYGETGHARTAKFAMDF